MTEGNLPKKPGTVVVPVDDDPLPIQRITGQERWKLSDLNPYLAFFHHGLLLTRGLPADPVADYIAQGGEGQLSCFMLDGPIVRGISEAEDRKLYAIDKDHGPELFRFLGSIAAISSEHREYWRAVAYAAKLPDVKALEKMTILPKRCPEVDVVFFGIDGMGGQLALSPAKRPPLDLPRVVVLPPDQKTIREGQALLKERRQ